jgi:succinate dehydrogenase / fumarate reductase flavoprotein subunit
MARNEKGLKVVLQKIPTLRQEFWENVTVLGEEANLNQSIEKAGRVADFLEFAELLCLDALTRAESCGGHFREEFQTSDGEALRNDDAYAHVSAWEYQGEDRSPLMHKEPLVYEELQMSQRSYK